MPTAVKCPTGGAYREALFNTSRCFRDPSLVGGAVVLDPLGMPKPISGASGSVFTVQTANNRQWAVKCFTRLVDHQAVRYQQISETMQAVSRPWRVEFEYLPDGVLCAGTWYPIVKMEWIEATGLIAFIEKHLWEPEAIASLAGKFVQMTRDLSTLNIAHGDLQHGNLLVTSSGELKLIDYDGMFVPGLARVGACEKGHINYQSPTRTMGTWGPYLDHFSEWVIYTSLVALTIDPTLWSLLHNQGDEALLFNHTDYRDPRSSRGLLALTQSSKPALHTLGAVMSNVWTPEVRAVPPLNPDDLPQLEVRPSPALPISPRIQPTTSGTARGAIPDWVTDAQAVVNTVAPKPSNDSSWVTGHLPPLQPVAFTSSRAWVRFLSLVFLAVIAATVIPAGLSLIPTAVAGSTSLLAALVFVALTVVLFRRTPQWRAKRNKAALFRACRSEVSSVSREVAKWDKARQEIDTREQKVITKISDQAVKARSAEQKELADANSQLALRIQQLQRQTMSLRSDEDRETGNTLRVLQEQHLYSYLSRASISSAKISGIGPAIVKSLATEGIGTAADFIGIDYSGGIQPGSQQVFIRLRNGYRVHPTGVGEKKARALDSWRGALEMQARLTQPARLSPAQAQAIQSKYIQQRQSLANEERTAQARTQVELKQITHKWMQNHTSISAELASTRQAFAQERAHADIELTAARKRASATAWQRDLAAREIAAHRNVSYARYLAGIFGILPPEVLGYLALTTGLRHGVGELVLWGCVLSSVPGCLV